MEINKGNLLDLLTSALSLAEVQELCAFLEIDYENLEGSTKTIKILSLIQYLDRRSRLPELITLLQQRRPDLDLGRDPTTPVTDLPPAKPTPPTTPTATAYTAELKQLIRFKQRGNLLLIVGGDLDSTLTGVASRQALSNQLADDFGLVGNRPLAKVALEAGVPAFLDMLNDELGRAPRQPHEIHLQCAKLVARNNLPMLLSLAYDSQLDRAFEALGTPAHLAVEDVNLRSRSFDKPLLIQLYGNWRQPRSLVVTDQEVNQLLRGNRDDKRDLLDAVRAAFRQNAVLFVGYDLDDSAVNALLDELAGDRFQQRGFALWQGLPESQARAWLTSRNLTVLDAAPVSFLQALLDG